MVRIIIMYIFVIFRIFVVIINRENTLTQYARKILRNRRYLI